MTSSQVEEIGVRPQKTKLQRFLRFVKKNPAGFAGMILVFLAVSAAVFAPMLVPFDPSKASLPSRLDPPSWADPTGESTFFLGADQLGRDLFSRIIYGARISLMVGFFGVLIALVIGTFMGLISGFFGKWLDDLIMRVADIQLAFPFILFAIVIMSVLGTGVWKIIIILGITYWVGFARLIRGQYFLFPNHSLLAHPTLIISNQVNSYHQL